MTGEFDGKNLTQMISDANDLVPIFSNFAHHGLCKREFILARKLLMH